MPRTYKPRPKDKRRPDIPRGKPPARVMNPNRANGAALTLAEVEAIRTAYAALRSERGVEKATGFSRNTIRRYLREGDPARGIAPLLDTIPPLPPPEPLPRLDATMHAPVSPGDLERADEGGDDSPVTRDGDDLDGDPPTDAPFTDPPATPPGRPLTAPVVPASTPGAPTPAPGPSAPLTAPSSAPAAPSVPGVGQPLPAAPVSPEPGEHPTDARGAAIKSVEHTVKVANAELARLSRNTRALYHSRMRALSSLVDAGVKNVKEGGKAKMTPAQRELLMVCREARIRGVELLALHRVEVGILGTTEAANAAGDIADTDDVLTIEGMRDELKELLAERANLLDDDSDAPAAGKG